MLITVVIESIHFGSSGGFLQIVIDDNQPVQSLINRFCEIKGSAVDPNYAIINDAKVSFDNSKKICEYQVQDNDHLRLGRKNQEINMFQFVRWSRISVFGIAVAVFGLIVTSLIYVLLRQVPYKFGVVFDAGSSHTDAIVYQYREKFHNTGEISQVANCSIWKNGIADVPISNVSAYLGKCLSEAKSYIEPAEALSETQVWFKATAGMRILQERNSSAVDSLLTEVKNTLSKSGFFYEDDNVNVMTGETEGLSGWISANSAKKGLKGRNPSEEAVNITTFGSLDLGGASMQLAVEIGNFDNGSIQSSYIHPVTLFNEQYNVYTQSFLCYGVGQALKRYRAALVTTQIQNQNDSHNVDSPCEPAGFTYKKKVSDIFQLPCTLDYEQSLPDKVHEDTVFTFTGTNDVGSCDSNVSFLTSPELCTRLKSPYCLNATTLPEELKTKTFVAYSAFGHVMNDMNMSKVVVREVFQRKLDLLCNMTYAHLTFWHSTFHLGITLRQLEELCFEGKYVYALLTKVLEFTSDEDWNRLEFTTEVNGVGLSWPYGFMLNETVYMTDSVTSIPEMAATSFWILFSVFSLLLVFGIMFFYHARRLGASSYERLNYEI